MALRRDVNVQHEIDGSVWRCIITDAQYPANTSGIVVMMDFSLPEEYQNALFNIFKDMEHIMGEASQKLFHEVQTHPAQFAQKHAR